MEYTKVSQNFGYLLGGTYNKFGYPFVGKVPYYKEVCRACIPSFPNDH